MPSRSPGRVALRTSGESGTPGRWCVSPPAESVALMAAASSLAAGVVIWGQLPGEEQVRRALCGWVRLGILGLNCLLGSLMVVV